MHDEAVRRQADEKRRAERRQRHLQDDLRYALKKLPEPIDINLPYEEVCLYALCLSEFTMNFFIGCTVDARFTRVQGSRR